MQGAAGCALTCSSSSKEGASAQAQPQAALEHACGSPGSTHVVQGREAAEAIAGKHVQQMPCDRQRAAHRAGRQQQAGRGRHAWWLAGQRVASLLRKIVSRL